MQDWVFVLAAVSAVASAIAALTSLMQARGTTQANEVSVYLRLMQDYSDGGMQESLLALGEYWSLRKDQFPNAGDAWMSDLAQDADLAAKIRRHARRVSHFFGAAARLYSAGFISGRLLRLLISRPGLNVYYDVVCPINVARQPKGQAAHFLQTLKRILPIYGDGSY